MYQSWLQLHPSECSRRGPVTLLPLKCHVFKTAVIIASNSIPMDAGSYWKHWFKLRPEKLFTLEEVSINNECCNHCHNLVSAHRRCLPTRSGDSTWCIIIQYTWSHNYLYTDFISNKSIFHHDDRFVSSLLVRLLQLKQHQKLCRYKYYLIINKSVVERNTLNSVVHQGWVKLHAGLSLILTSVLVVTFNLCAIPLIHLDCPSIQQTVN